MREQMLVIKYRITEREGAESALRTIDKAREGLKQPAA
jgi:hypothetical protein